LPPPPSWRRDIATALWVALVSALLAPLLGLLLTALALDIAAVAGTGAATGYGAVGRFVGFLAAVPYTYVLALVFMGVPSALCGLVLGVILARLARAGRAAPPVRAAAGAAVAATFAALIGWLPDESGADLPYPMWSVATACGAACGIVVRRTWLSRRIAMPA
jgi:hypothetical protein